MKGVPTSNEGARHAASSHQQLRRSRRSPGWSPCNARRAEPTDSRRIALAAGSATRSRGARGAAEDGAPCECQLRRVELDARRAACACPGGERRRRGATRGDGGARAVDGPGGSRRAGWRREAAARAACASSVKPRLRRRRGGDGERGVDPALTSRGGAQRRRRGVPPLAQQPEAQVRELQGVPCDRPRRPSHPRAAAEARVGGVARAAGVGGGDGARRAEARWRRNTAEAAAEDRLQLGGVDCAGPTPECHSIVARRSATAAATRCSRAARAPSPLTPTPTANGARSRLRRARAGDSCARRRCKTARWPWELVHHEHGAANARRRSAAP